MISLFVFMILSEINRYLFIHIYAQEIFYFFFLFQLHRSYRTLSMRCIAILLLHINDDGLRLKKRKITNERIIFVIHCIGIFILIDRHINRHGTRFRLATNAVKHFFFCFLFEIYVSKRIEFISLFVFR